MSFPPPQIFFMAVVRHEATQDRFSLHVKRAPCFVRPFRGGGGGRRDCSFSTPCVKFRNRRRACVRANSIHVQNEVSVTELSVKTILW